ncbi:MAG: SDR family NAD(P)-dependent oxidoreductase [Desulfarculales bacterium]|nr:SDR family NAD(P)-dependent oxidoreductase [Desulfarculales bacterium]
MVKIACITGVTSGIGKATAAYFVKEGWKVIGAGRRAERLQELARTLGTNFFPLQLDIRDQEAVNRAFASLPQAFTPVDLLVNNAGLALGMETAWEASLEDWDTMVDTNIKGLLYCTRALLPDMVKRNHGHIINVGSVVGAMPYAKGNVYSASKGFVEMFSANLKCDLFGSKVRVTNFEPGMLESEFSLARFRGDGERAAAVYKNIDALAPEDLSQTIYYVANLPEHINVLRIQVVPTSMDLGGIKMAPKG